MRKDMKKDDSFLLKGSNLLSTSKKDTYIYIYVYIYKVDNLV